MGTLFVTGTDTDAGKTTASAWICSHLSNVSYWKPLQTGKDSDSHTVQILSPHTKIIPEVYRLKAPLSAFDAAKKEGINIDIDRLKPPRQQNILIEGAGGILVPIKDHFSMIDLADLACAQVLIVARAKLGIMNHIFLTVEVLRQRSLPIVGIIICGNIDSSWVETIEHFSNEKVLTILPESHNQDFSELFHKIPVPVSIMEVFDGTKFKREANR